MDLRVVFMGSPEFALPTLQALSENYLVVGVVTQPDKPAGRGRKLASPPIKTLAEHLDLPVIQPHRLRQPDAMEKLKTWNPDLVVVAAFGQILRPTVLDMPRWGCINVHASLLPRWRGAAPIHAAILAGDTETGISIMQMDPGVDTGPVLSQHSLSIAPDETTGMLSDRLATLGAALLIETLPAYLAGEITPCPQEDLQLSAFDSIPTYASVLKKSDGLLNFNEAAEMLARRVRAFHPWPGTFAIWQGQYLKVLRAFAVSEAITQPNEHCLYQDLPAIGTAAGLLVLEEVQPAGKKAMLGKVFLQGARHWLDA